MMKTIKNTLFIAVLIFLPTILVTYEYTRQKHILVQEIGNTINQAMVSYDEIWKSNNLLVMFSKGFGSDPSDSLKIQSETGLILLKKSDRYKSMKQNEKELAIRQTLLSLEEVPNFTTIDSIFQRSLSEKKIAIEYAMVYTDPIRGQEWIGDTAWIEAKEAQPVEIPMGISDEISLRLYFHIPMSTILRSLLYSHWQRLLLYLATILAVALSIYLYIRRRTRIKHALLLEELRAHQNELTQKKNRVAELEQQTLDLQTHLSEINTLRQENIDRLNAMREEIRRAIEEEIRTSTFIILTDTLSYHKPTETLIHEKGEVSLTNQQKSILRELLSSPGYSISRDGLAKVIFGMEVDRNRLRQAIFRLNERLAEVSNIRIEFTPNETEYVLIIPAT